MAKSDKLLFLFSLLLLFAVSSLNQGSAPLRETVIETAAPSVLVGPVDLNSADADTLCLLPGVGPVIAERIIEYRERAGGFGCVEELLTIRGIGDATLEKIYDYMINYMED